MDTKPRPSGSKARQKSSSQQATASPNDKYSNWRLTQAQGVASNFAAAKVKSGSSQPTKSGSYNDSNNQSKSGQNSSAYTSSRSGYKSTTKTSDFLLGKSDKEFDAKVKDPDTISTTSSTLSEHVDKFDLPVRSSAATPEEEATEERVSLDSIKSLYTDRADSEILFPRVSEVEENGKLEEMKFRASQKIIKSTGFNASSAHFEPPDTVSQKLQFSIEKSGQKDSPSIFANENGRIRVQIPTSVAGWKNHTITKSIQGFNISMKANESGWVVTGKKAQKVLYQYSVERFQDEILTKLLKSSYDANLECFELNGTNLIVDGQSWTRNMTLNSVKDIRINSPVHLDSLTLQGPHNIVLNNSILVKKFEADSGLPFLLDGQIAGKGGTTADSPLEIGVKSKFAQIGASGIIGAKCNGQDKADFVEVSISGPLLNYGKITATENLELHVQQIESVQENKHDTAHRCQEAYRKLNESVLSEIAAGDTSLLNPKLQLEKENQLSASKTYESMEKMWND